METAIELRGAPELQQQKATGPQRREKKKKQLIPSGERKQIAGLAWYDEQGRAQRPRYMAEEGRKQYGKPRSSAGAV